MITLARRCGLLSLLVLAAAPAARGQEAPARFTGGAVAADHEIASQAGAAMLRAGGNAVDAAVATSFALSVVRPFSCGIGGGGFMVIHLNHDPRHGTIDVALNYREQAPASAAPDLFEKLAASDPHASTRGAKAVAIPGTVAGLLHALETYGTLDRATVLAPAIRAAEEGFLADAAYRQAYREDIEPHFRREPGLRTRFAFLWSTLCHEGELGGPENQARIVLPQQARVLRLIAERGLDGFRDGPVGDEIVAAIAADGGALTKADLASFKVQTLRPLETSWMGRRVVTMPPPSSGGIVLAQVFATLSARPENLRELGHDSPAYTHLVVEACKHAFADRARSLADPDFTPIPMDRLLDPAMLRRRAEAIDPARTDEPEKYGWSGPQLPADGGTSHLSVIDAKGNAVACTETINLVFGSWLAVDGFCLNNQMDDFLTQRGKPNAFGLTQADANLPAPGKRPLSSMSPTLLLEDGAGGPTVRMAVGASGGPKIISGTLQAILNATVFQMDAGGAVGSWRFHHQWKPNELLFEPRAEQEPYLRWVLTDLGHEAKVRRTGLAVGVVQMVTRGSDGVLEAASDPRKGGRPAGVGPAR